MQVAGFQYKTPLLGVPAKLAQLYTDLQEVGCEFFARGPGFFCFVVCFVGASLHFVSHGVAVHQANARVAQCDLHYVNG